MRAIKRMELVIEENITFLTYKSYIIHKNYLDVDHAVTEYKIINGPKFALLSNSYKSYI